MGRRVSADEGSGTLDVSALAASLVFKALGVHWNQGFEAEILWIDQVSAIAVWHTNRISVNHLDDSKVRVEELNRKSDLP